MVMMREQAPLHDAEALHADRVPGVGVIHEQARQIEQSGEPGDHRDHMEGLEPEQKSFLDAQSRIIAYPLR